MKKTATRKLPRLFWRPTLRRSPACAGEEESNPHFHMGNGVPARHSPLAPRVGIEPDPGFQSSALPIELPRRRHTASRSPPRRGRACGKPLGAGRGSRTHLIRVTSAVPSHEDETSRSDRGSYSPPSKTPVIQTGTSFSPPPPPYKGVRGQEHGQGVEPPVFPRGLEPPGTLRLASGPYDDRDPSPCRQYPPSPPLHIVDRGRTPSPSSGPHGPEPSRLAWESNPAFTG